MRFWRPTKDTLQIEGIGYFEVSNGAVIRSPGNHEAPIPIEPMSFYTAMIKLGLEGSPKEVFEFVWDFIDSHRYAIDPLDSYPRVQKRLSSMSADTYVFYDNIACQADKGIDKFHLYNYLKCKWR